MKPSPTVRTLKWIRKQGYTADVSEHYNSFAHTRRDLFNFIDIVAIKEDTPGVLAIQCTIGAHVNSRIRKIVEECTPASKIWLLAGNRILVVGWRELVKKRKDGTKAKKGRWEPLIKEITLHSGEYAGWGDGTEEVVNP